MSFTGLDFLLILNGAWVQDPHPMSEPASLLRKYVLTRFRVVSFDKGEWCRVQIVFDGLRNFGECFVNGFFPGVYLLVD